MFLYREVLRQDFGRLEGLVRARRPKRLPVVFDRDEIRRLFETASFNNLDSNAFDIVVVDEFESDERVNIRIFALPGCTT